MDNFEHWLAITKGYGWDRVLLSADDAAKYREKGWTVVGPFVLQPPEGAVSDSFNGDPAVLLGENERLRATNAGMNRKITELRAEVASLRNARGAV